MPVSKINAATQMRISQGSTFVYFFHWKIIFTTVPLVLQPVHQLDMARALITHVQYIHKAVVSEINRSP